MFPISREMLQMLSVPFRPTK